MRPQRANTMSLDNALIVACEKGELDNVKKIIAQKNLTPEKLSDQDKSRLLGAAIWGININVTKYVYEDFLRSEGSYLESSLSLNNSVYGASYPVFKPVSNLTLFDLHDYYSSTSGQGGQKALFSDWLWVLTGRRDGAMLRLERSGNNVTTVDRIGRRLTSAGGAVVMNAQVRQHGTIWNYGPFCERYKRCVSLNQELQSYVTTMRSKFSDLKKQREEEEKRRLVELQKKQAEEKRRQEELQKKKEQEEEKRRLVELQKKRSGRKET